MPKTTPRPVNSGDAIETAAAHECEWVPVTTDGPLGHGWECTICGEYQAG